jgi:predicted RNA-binding protein with PIN domain
MAEPTLYLFDGYNLLHASGSRDRQQLIDRLASYVAVRGARGVVVFDGVGEDAVHGPLEVRFAASADRLLERLAAEHRQDARIQLVSTDQAVRETAGQEVGKTTSKEFLRDLATEAGDHDRSPPKSPIEDALDATTRAKLEEWRRKRT